VNLSLSQRMPTSLHFTGSPKLLIFTFTASIETPLFAARGWFPFVFVQQKANLTFSSTYHLLLITS
jgi:hypothetical protein